MTALPLPIRLFAAIVCLMALPSRSPAEPPAAAAAPLRHHNPLWEGNFADPFVLQTGGVYYAYGTGDHDYGGRAFPVLRSRDFLNWELVGGAVQPALGLKLFWAPEVAERDGKFYLYYAGGAEETGNRLRVAVADKPEGPFIDAGKELISGEPFSIDPHPFRDPADGQWYLFFAKDFLDGPRPGTALAAVKLGADMVSVTGPVTTILRATADWQIYLRNRTMYGRVFDAWHTVEGPSLVCRDGKYWLFYSGGNWAQPGYGVGCAVAANILGPYDDSADAHHAAILRTVPGKAIGPGHNSTIVGPDGLSYIVYHKWDDAHTGRRICIDPLDWSSGFPRWMPGE